LVPGCGSCFQKRRGEERRGEERRGEERRGEERRGEEGVGAYAALSQLDVLCDERTRGIRKALDDGDEAGEPSALVVLAKGDGPVAPIGVVEVAIEVVLHLVQRASARWGGEGGGLCCHQRSGDEGEAAYDKVELGSDLDAADLLLLGVVKVELEHTGLQIPHHRRPNLAQ